MDKKYINFLIKNNIIKDVEELKCINNFDLWDIIKNRKSNLFKLLKNNPNSIVYFEKNYKPTLIISNIKYDLEYMVKFNFNDFEYYVYNLKKLSK